VVEPKNMNNYIKKVEKIGKSIILS
jgi:hypothetical protein